MIKKILILFLICLLNISVAFALDEQRKYQSLEDFNKAFENTPVWAARHHECLNGEGYPAGLKGDELGLDERILAVSDIWDALLATDRPYKKPIPLDKAFEIMRDMASEGRIDGKVVGYLYDCLREQ